MIEALAIYLSSYITASVLKSALMYPIVGPWRSAIVKLGLPVAIIEAEIIATGTACAVNIVKRHIAELRKPKK